MSFVSTITFPKLEPTSGSEIANWKSGAATSGLAGADLVTIGANDITNILHTLIVAINALEAAANINVRLYAQVNGTERRIDPGETYIKGTDPDGLTVVNSPLAIHEAVRVEVYSDNILDDGKAIAYDYLLEAN